MPFSIVVPFRNGHGSIGRLLGSLPSGQRVIVVDDQSDPPYQTNDPRVEIVRPERRGYFSGAANAGIAAAGRDDVLICNQDLRFPDGLPVQVLEDLAARFGVFGDGVMGHGAWPKGYVQGTCMYIRRDVIDRIGVLDGETWPLWGATCEYQARACRAGFKAKPIDHPPWIEHERGDRSFGSSIAAALKEEPAKRRLLIRTPPMISVVISCYNYGRFLPDAIASLVGGPSSIGPLEQQTFGGFEVVIVDDGSTDDSAEIGRSLVDPWKAIRFVRRSHNGGTPAANNTGIKAAHGSVIAMLCADDMMESWRLRTMYDALRRARGRVFVYDNCRVVTNGRRLKVLDTGDPPDLCAMAYQNTIHAGIMMHKGAWREVGGYADAMRYGREDWEINLSLMAADYRPVHVDRAGYLYRRENHNRTLTNTTLEWRGRFLAQLRALHPEVYSMCYSCGGGRAARRKPAARTLKVAKGAFAMVSLAGEKGMTLIQYIGPHAGTSSWWGPVTRIAYEFGQARPVGYVDDRDLRTKNPRNPGLLEMTENGAPAFRLFTSPKPKETTIVVTDTDGAAMDETLVAESLDLTENVPALGAVEVDDGPIAPAEIKGKVIVLPVTETVHAALLERFGDLDGIHAASDAEILEIRGIGRGTLAKIREVLGYDA